MYNGPEQTDSMEKTASSLEDKKLLIESIVRLLSQADDQKLHNIYHFIVHII